jgi:cytochrome c-type biogenesis protein CcmH
MKPAIDELRRKLQQLQAQHENGSLTDDAYAEARRAIESELADQVLLDAPPARPRPALALQAVLALGVALLAAGGYYVTGSPAQLGVASPKMASNASGSNGTGAPPVDDEQVAKIVDGVAQRLKEKPDDAAGWALLARAYSAMGRFTEAVPAYKKALELVGDEATLLADYADVLGALNDGKLGPESVRLVERALVLEPGNVKALALSGSAAFERQDYATAVRQWEKVALGLPADSQLLPQVRASIAQAREAGGLPPTAQLPPSPAKPAPAAAPAAAVSGQVTVAPALAGQVGPEDTVFILARAASGTRMPLAVLRKKVKDLPASFTLDDSMAMAPTARISDHAQIIVSARISKSGDAMPQPGDLTGHSAVVAPGATGVSVQIADVYSK